MHYIDKAREIQKELKKRNITAYEYARLCKINPSSYTNYVRYLRLSERVQEQIKKSTTGIRKAGLLLKLIGIRDDDFIIKVIKLDKIKKFDYYKLKRLVENELERG